MRKTWLAKFAGAIDIVAGCLALVGGFCLMPGILSKSAKMPGYDVFIIIVVFLPLLVFGILTFIGGIFNLVGKKWGWALTGSISSLIVVAFLSLAATGIEFHPMLGLFAIFLGIIAIVFTSVARKGFI